MDPVDPAAVLVPGVVVRPGIPESQDRSVDMGERSRHSWGMSRDSVQARVWAPKRVRIADRLREHVGQWSLLSGDLPHVRIVSEDRESLRDDSCPEERPLRAHWYQPHRRSRHAPDGVGVLPRLMGSGYGATVDHRDRVRADNAWVFDPIGGGFTLVINPEKATAEICHERFPRNRVVLIGSLEEILNRILRIEGTYGVGSIGEQLFLWVLLDDREEISHLKYGLRQSEEALADERLWARVLEGAVDRAVVHVHDHVRVCAAGRRLTLLDAYLQNFWAQDPGSMIARGASLDRILVPPMHTLSPSEAELERIFSIQRARRVSEKWNPVAAGV